MNVKRGLLSLPGARIKNYANQRNGDFPLNWIRTAGALRGTQSKRYLPGLWGGILQVRRKQQDH